MYYCKRRKLLRERDTKLIKYTKFQYVAERDNLEGHPTLPPQKIKKEITKKRERERERRRGRKEHTTMNQP